MWFFTLMFPLLMGGPVSVEVVTVDQAQCKRVHALLSGQLLAHRSNAKVSDCQAKPEN